MSLQFEKRRLSSSEGTRATPSLQRRCACGGVAGPDGECESCKRKRLAGLLQKKTDRVSPAKTEGAIPATVHQTLQSPGRPLDTAARASLEPHFNRDFSEVRVHTDDTAAKSAKDVNALAYTVGRNVVFSAGQYAPQTDDGRALLAHELTHVVQQGGASYDASQPLAIGARNDPLEREAETAAGGLGSFKIAGRSTGEIQRSVVKTDGSTGVASTESDCSGWFADHESLSKRAAELYVRTELGGNHGAVKKVECDMVAANGAFGCTVTFADGTPIRVIARPDSIVVGKYPLQTMTPPADQPLCFYSFKCPGPNRDLVLTKIRCQSSKKPDAENSPDDHRGKGPNP